MYSGEAVLFGHNVLQVMYAAKKYLLDDLVKRCSKFLEDEISKDNVCTVLKHCLFYDETTLAEKCVAFVAADPKVVFESPDFMNINEATLHHLLSDAEVYIKPVDALKYTLKWAKSQLNDQTELISVREILGKSLYQIPFSSMSCHELADIIGDEPDLLNDKEQATLFRYMANKAERDKAAVSLLGFMHKKIKADSYLSKICHSMNRFNRTTKHSSFWNGIREKPDIIAFQVDQDIKFHGVTIFGGYTAVDTHSVVVQLYEGTTQLCNYKYMTTSSGTATPIDVPIPTAPINVRSGTRYTIKIGRVGPQTFSGDAGTDCVTTEGCTFSYYTCPLSKETNVFIGQIPQIMFSKSH